MQTAKESRELKKKTKARWKKPRKPEEEYSPFPPPQQQRKVDLQMETGEFFQNEKTRKQQKHVEMQEKQV
jgi:ribosomal RNA assembly protein